MAATNIRKGRDKPKPSAPPKPHVHASGGYGRWCAVRGCDFWWDGVQWIAQ